MKSIILLLLALPMSHIAFSQTAAEWTQQQKTQRKYSLQQIAALQTYLEYVKNGYHIADKGILSVQNYKNGEWNLHKDFFNSLSVVKPAIEKYAKVANIISMHAKMVKRVRSLILKAKNRVLLNAEESRYIMKVCDHLLSECLKNTEELIMLITSHKLEMKDDERITRIETIYADMQDKSVFLLSFGNSITLLSQQRIHEKLEVAKSEKIHGLNR